MLDGDSGFRLRAKSESCGGALDHPLTSFSSRKRVKDRVREMVCAKGQVWDPFFSSQDGL